MKYILAIVNLLTAWYQRRQADARKQIYDQIEAKQAEINRLSVEMVAWIAGHGGPGRFDFLHQQYTSARESIRRLRARLPKGDPARSE